MGAGVNEYFDIDDYNNCLEYEDTVYEKATIDWFHTFISLSAQCFKSVSGLAIQGPECNWCQ